MSQQTRDKIEIFLGSALLLAIGIIGFFLMQLISKVETTHDSVIRLEVQVQGLIENKHSTKTTISHQ